MTIALYECKMYFKQKGLKVNLGKCDSRGMLPVKAKTNMKVVTTCHRKCNNKPIPTLDFKRLSKYLRVYVHIDREVALRIAEWNGQLEGLRKSHLTSIQKVQTVVAKMLYQLRLSDHGLKMTRKLHRSIRKVLNTLHIDLCNFLTIC